MKHHPVVTLFFSALTVSSLLFGVWAHVQKGQEVQRRIYVEESLIRVTRAKMAMTEELEAQKGKAAALERQLVAMQQTNRFILTRLRGLERKFSMVKRSLESEIGSMRERLSEEVDLGQIVVSATPSLEGKVLAVNRQFQFVVIDLGSSHHLPVGAVLSIYREKDLIGRVQVEEVRDAVAACRILPEWTRREIQENDFVKEL